MGEFDLSLIQEFRSRPAFYDRNSSLFKDKMFLAREWQEISNKLGYDVSLLKDRMLQLRNRYNLEKRRIEQLIEENPGRRNESPWPLYEHLQFLSDHIRSRRSYKFMSAQQNPSRHSTVDATNSDSNPSLEDNSNYHATMANGLLDVKLETRDSEEDETARNLAAEPSMVNEESVPPLVPLKRSQRMQRRTIPYQSATKPTGRISVRTLDKLQEKTQKRLNMVSVPTPLVHNSQPPPPSSTDETPTIALPKRARPHSREDKFFHFGEFMAASLLDMPAHKSLRLVQQFTSELVKIMLEKNEAEAGKPNCNGLRNAED